MSETKMSKIARRRRARLQRDGKAVSPVVATLILILVAVAAAAALYLWLVAWQGNVTGTIGQPGPQSTVTIGGSTSVYPFDAVAVPQFEANNSGISISNNPGGTGAGMLAVCHGAIDIGASSSLQTVSGLESADGCPATTVITTVAYDAVDVAVPVANTHGLQSISFDTLTAIYDRASTASTPTLVATTIDGALLSATPLSTIPAGPLTWNEVPACVAGATSCGGVTGTDLPEAVETSAAVGAGVACPGNAALICSTTGTPAGVSPCGFTICAGGANNVIKTVARSDASGTTQSFEARLLGATSATAFATSLSGLGFSGCGSNNLIADCGMTATLTASGNPAVITTIAGSADSIGYASDGLIKNAGSGVVAVSFLAPGQLAGTGTGYTNGGVFPSTGATGTIAAGITSSTTVPNYAGWRPFEYVTTNTPTGEVQRFIQYVLDPANNLNFASESYEVSIYSI
jgi:flagellin-like protein